MDIDIKQIIRTVPDFPKPGINFFDITSIFENPEAFKKTVRWLTKLIAKYDIQHIAAVDARGFVWGGAVAHNLMVPLHLARKPGKLPGDVVTREYALEYGSSSLSMLKSAPINGKVMVIDDLLATGGTLNAVGDLLVENWKIRPEQQVHAVIVELSFLQGKSKLEDLGYIVETMVSY